MSMGVSVVVGDSWVARFLSHEGFVLRKATRKRVLSDHEMITRE